jgi:uncharacterized protein DUF6702
VVIPWLAIVLCGLAAPRGHPVHSSAAEIREVSGRIVVTIRVFPDDLNTAVPGASAGHADSALADYVQRTFEIAGRDGRAVPLRWEGLDRAGDVLEMRLESGADVTLSGTTVRHGLLLERFPDQVNVVRASYGPHTATLLFMRGDDAKRLP